MGSPHRMGGRPSFDAFRSASSSHFTTRVASTGVELVFVRGCRGFSPKWTAFVGTRGRGRLFAPTSTVDPFECSYGGGGRRSGCNLSSASHDPFDRPSTHFVLYFGSIGMHCSSRRSLGWGVGSWSLGCAATSLLDWISTTLSFAPFLLSHERRGWIFLFCLLSFWLVVDPLSSLLPWDLSQHHPPSTFDGPFYPSFLSFPFLSLPWYGGFVGE